MTIRKDSLRDKLTIPAIAAPMFLVSGPDLVVETCRCGIMGTFPALNQRTSEGYAAWLDEIQERLDRIEAATGVAPSPFGVNLIVHKTNARLARDIEITVRTPGAGRDHVARRGARSGRRDPLLRRPGVSRCH